MAVYVHQDENAIYKIYKLTGPTGKVYIGCTKQTPARRWNNGRGYRNNPVLNAEIQKYGWAAFKKEILCDRLLKEAAEQLEDKFIQYYDSRNPEKGYNFYTGGNRHGAEMSDLGKLHHSKSSTLLWTKPDYAEKQHKERRGRFAGNNEKCRQMSAAVKLAFSDPEFKRIQREKMLAYYARGNRPQTKRKACYCIETGTYYPSCHSAGLAVGVNSSVISTCCQGRRYTAGGYHWRYAEPEKTGGREKQTEQ